MAAVEPMRNPRIEILAAAILLMGVLASVAPATAEVCTPPIPDLQGETEEPVCDTDLPICEEGVEGACGEEPPQTCDPTGGAGTVLLGPECELPPPPCVPGAQQPADTCEPTPDPCASGCDPCDEPEQPCDVGPVCDDEGGCNVDPCEEEGIGTAAEVCEEGDCESTSGGTPDGLCPEPCQDSDSCTPPPPEDPCAGGCEPCPGNGAQTWEVIEDQPAVNLNDEFSKCIQDPCDMTHGVCEPCTLDPGSLEFDEPQGAPNPLVPEEGNLEGRAEYWLSLTDDVPGCDEEWELPLPLVPLHRDIGRLTESPGHYALEGDDSACHSHDHLTQTHWDYDIELVAYFNTTHYRGTIGNQLLGIGSHAVTSDVHMIPSATRVVLATYHGRHWDLRAVCEIARAESRAAALVDAPGLYDDAQLALDYRGWAQLNAVPMNGPDPYLITTGRMPASCLRLDHDLAQQALNLPSPWAWEGFFLQGHIPHIDSFVSVFGTGQSALVAPSSPVGTGLCLPAGSTVPPLP